MFFLLFSIPQNHLKSFKFLNYSLNHKWSKKLLQMKTFHKRTTCTGSKVFFPSNYPKRYEQNAQSGPENNTYSTYILWTYLTELVCHYRIVHDRALRPLGHTIAMCVEGFPTVIPTGKIVPAQRNRKHTTYCVKEMHSSLKDGSKNPKTSAAPNSEMQVLTGRWVNFEDVIRRKPNTVTFPH